MTKSLRFLTIASLTILACHAPAAGAEASELSLAKQYGDSYLPLMIMERQRLVEKQAEKLGLKGLTVNWISVSGGATANDALLSGKLDFVSGGVGPMLQLWSATKGTVKGVAALNAVPLLLNTNNPSVKSIKDFTEKDKIAVPAVGVSMQSVILRMAAEKAFGESNYKQLDRLTVTMTQADATAALLSGRSEITGHFANSPFQYQELKDPKIRSVLNSYEVLGGPASFGMLWTTSKFHEQNPLLYRAVLAALGEAVARINADKRAAAEMYVDMAKSKLSVDFVYRILSDPQVTYSTTPKNTMRLALFMYKIGQIKMKPDSWKDYFFPEISGVPGS